MNMLKLFFLTGILIFSLGLRAQMIDVEVSPPEPLINESFFVTFNIKTTGNVEPYISFTPVGATVQGKREQGVSISTTVINGKFATTREQSYVYELIAERSGQVTLKNIKIEIDGKVTNVKDAVINVLSQSRKIPDAFMEASTSKTKVYLGEGMDVNYYLYFKTSIAANDVKEFPKLNKFIKRFHHVNSPVETVQYKGQMFKRILAYSARLYPEKIGHAVLDPMIISVQIIENDSSSPYGAFGMVTQRYRNKDLSSPRIEVEVLPLPSDNVPTSFTGLVGEHEFSLSVPKNKFLVNEPIEVKFEVKGKGAIENMDAPSLYVDNNLEQFDTKSEVTELGAQLAKKNFDYTFLARGPLSLKARELSFAYFDPASGRYVEKKISVPAIDISGSASVTSGSSGTNQSQIKNTDKVANAADDFFAKVFSPSPSKSIEKNTVALVGPVFKAESSWSSRWFDVINVILSVLILATVGVWYYFRDDLASFEERATKLKKEISKMKHSGLNYSDLYKVISCLDKQNKMAAGGISITQIIDESFLSQDAKSYLKNALLVCEEKNFGISKSNGKIVFENRYFKEILKNI